MFSLSVVDGCHHTTIMEVPQQANSAQQSAAMSRIFFVMTLAASGFLPDECLRNDDFTFLSPSHNHYPACGYEY